MNEVTFSMLEKIKELAASSKSDTVAFRHHLHTHPEIAWQEVETTRAVAEELKKIGCDIVKIGFGGTECGVVADLRGGKPGKRVALRGDMDALPMNEDNDLPYRSRKDGVMHACGHDAHTAMLLWAAKVLSEIRDDIPGTVRFLFQPAEESGLKSGAKAMVEEGALEGVDAVAGIHCWSSAPTGTVLYRSGPIMAAADGWYLTLKGKGGHGSTPELCIDPTITAANIVLNLQAIVGREVSAKETVVVSTGTVKAGLSVFNIIPDSVEMNGTVRSFNPAVQDHVESALRRVIAGACQIGRCTFELDYKRFIPATINEPAVTAVAKDVFDEVFGADNVKETPLIMGSEDFSYFQQKVPGTYYLLGTGNPEKGTDNAHHHPKFNVDDDALPAGVASLAGFAWTWLSKNA
ncbi:MAG: amidohydrolase [Aminivibrio sp.]|nr:amidohydrolase [Aminivibrio sp.]